MGFPGINKHIFIIGGGISGLTVLHQLKKKYAGQTGMQIQLLERNAYVGGTAYTELHEQTIFEHGPNGFLNHHGSTFQLVRELGLETELIQAGPSAKLRFICLKNKLHALPAHPLAFLRFPFFSITDKFKVLAEVFVPRSSAAAESVYDFAARRFGERFAQYLIDPMVSGVFGGDARELCLPAAFPQIYEMEQKYGSLIKGMLAVKKQKGEHLQRPQMASFKSGMSQLSETIFKRYSEAIQTSVDVRSIRKISEGFVVETPMTQYFAHEIFLCTPAYVAADLLKEMSQDLSQALAKVIYAPLAVVGLVYKRSAFRMIPQGFGYLIPSSEGKDVLGVLFCSNIFAGRSAAEEILFRVMIGGVRHPDSVKKTEAELFNLAHREIAAVLGVEEKPVEQLIKIWPKAIPQYDKDYVSVKERLLRGIKAFPELHLAANYLNGISLNDCIANAYNAVK